MILLTNVTSVSPLGASLQRTSLILGFLDLTVQISIFPHQNPPFLGPAGKSIKLIVIGICLDNTAAAQRNISGCRYNCEVCEMKLTWKTYSTVLFYPFYDIYSLAYSSIANMKKSLIYTIITLKTATQHLKVSFALTDMRIQ